MSELKEKYCRACEAGMPAMSLEEAQAMMDQVEGWELGEGMLSRRFKFKNFKEAMSFVNKVADIAEEEGHHPDIYISWNRVRLDLTTHVIKGLSENDFIMAAKVDEVVSSR
jgi:4a-hydroxytetrahydrobiopterin dehydratase